MGMTFPGESADYRAARDRLLARELELRRSMESIAAERRALPPGGAVSVDYEFQERGEDGTSRPVRLSALFAPGRDSLAVYHFMFPRSRHDDRPGPPVGETAALPLHDGPCPSCTALLDQLDGMVPHSAQRTTFVVAAETTPDRLAAFARERGWRHLRLVSTAGSSFSRDYHGTDDDGDPWPMLNVFHRDGDVVRHFWGAELMRAPTDPGQDMRHVGVLEPLWNLFDLIPEGRGDGWDEQLDYRCCHRPVP